LPEILSSLANKEAIRRTAQEKRNEIDRLETQAIKERYALVDRVFSSLEELPDFQETLHQEGLEYLWSHPDGHMDDDYLKEIDHAGWIKRKDGGVSHVLGIDLDRYPLRTEDEIKFRAIKKYAKDHPELHIEM